MPTYDYTAIDAAGRTRTGCLSSDSPDAARRSMEKKGLVVTSLQAGASGASAPSSPSAPRVRDRGRLPGKMLAIFSRQLATLITVAPLEESLRTLRDQTENRRLRRVLTGTHEGLVEGLRLSDAMGRVGGFPPTYRAMIAAGEGSSALPAVLERLADLLERQQDTQSKITAALVYPMVLSVVAAVVIIGLMTFVVPRVVDQFNVTGAELPPLTQAIIAISDTLQAWGWLMGLVLGGAILLFAWAMTQPALRYGFDKLLLGLPLIGRVLRDVEAAGFARTLSTMLSSGLPVMEALQLAARTSGNGVIRKAASQMAAAVSEGASLSAAMRRTNAFPPLLVYLAANGEGGGKLDDMLGRAADYLEREFRTSTSIALSLLEPAIIVIMGGVVCLVILSILLPILQINTLNLG